MQFEVNRNDFRETRVVPSEPAALMPGQIRLAVERFAFTTNNISYAVSGDMLDYWGFFPTAAPWGRIPAMGLASVTESAIDEIPVGGRYFGFYPMADELVISAAAATDGFTDVGAHRGNHAGAYTGFVNVEKDPVFRNDRANEYLLLRGLFMTSFLVDDFLGDSVVDDADFFGATQTLVSSASSKTSIALASCLSTRGHHSVGLTSSRNQSFVEGLRLYDEVITYDDIETLDQNRPTVFVDMAGNATVRGRIHRHFTTALLHSAQIGATHWEAMQMDPGADLPGPAPQFFFAPAQMAKRSKEWGPGELMKRIGAALGAFLESAPTWLAVEPSAGPDAVTAVYMDLLEGRADPSVGHIVSMADDG